MKKITDLLCKALSGLLFVLIILLVALTFLQVLCRFVFKIPISWSEESVRMCFVWIIFLGSAVAVKEGTHLMLDMLTSHLPGFAQKVLRVLVLVGMTVCSGVLLWGSIDYCTRTWNKSMIAVPLPAWCLNLAVPISAALMILFLIEKILEEFAPHRKGEGA